MATTVEITLSDDGKVLVGITDTPSDPSAMQPAGSIQEALAMARHILQPGKVAGPQRVWIGPARCRTARRCRATAPRAVAMIRDQAATQPAQLIRVLCGMS
jgi:hypothetical protein